MKLARGYTLIEMVVVMSIMAILSTLGAAALFSARTSAQVDAVSQELVAAIRQAQNNAISIKEGGSCPWDTTNDLPTNTKVWGVEISRVSPDSGFSLIYYCGNDRMTTAVPTYVLPVPRFSPYPDVEIRENGGNSWGYIYFSAPFGKGYVATPPNSLLLAPAGNPQKEWQPVDMTRVTTSDITWTVSKNGYERYVTVKPNGDVYER